MVAEETRRVRHVVTISGKDSLATAELLRRAGVEFELIHNAVGAEPPEVSVWLDKVEAYFGQPIMRIGVNLEAMIEDHGFLPSARMRYCTRQTKIEPMEDYLGTDDDIFLYLGIRADEQRIGYAPPKDSRITPVYPLQIAGYGINEVYALVDSIDLTPPTFHWPRLEAEVRRRLGDDADALIASLNRADRIGLFAGRSRPNCYFCFFQRVYEWVWLSEAHPALFERACVIEETTGGDGYTWRRGEPLRSLVQRSDAIVARRADAVASLIRSGSQMRLDLGDEDNAELGLLNVVSCGLFCGK